MHVIECVISPFSHRHPDFIPSHYPRVSNSYSSGHISLFSCLKYSINDSYGFLVVAYTISSIGDNCKFFFNVKMVLCAPSGLKCEILALTIKDIAINVMMRNAIGKKYSIQSINYKLEFFDLHKKLLYLILVDDSQPQYVIMHVSYSNLVVIAIQSFIVV